MLLVDDAPQHRRRDAALRGPRRPRHEHVLAREERERDLREELLALDERAPELVEEQHEPRARGLEPLQVDVRHTGERGYRKRVADALT